MKYIINKNQFNLLFESKDSSWIKRRISNRLMDRHISDAIDNYPDLCERFENVKEYIEAIIYDATYTYLREMDDFESIPLQTGYLLEEYFFNSYSDYLSDTYKKTCE
jgi:hypothetical protein